SSPGCARRGISTWQRADPGRSPRRRGRTPQVGGHKSPLWAWSRHRRRGILGTREPPRRGRSMAVRTLSIDRRHEQASSRLDTAWALAALAALALGLLGGTLHLVFGLPAS